MKTILKIKKILKMEMVRMVAENPTAGKIVIDAVKLSYYLFGIITAIVLKAMFRFFARRKEKWR